MKSLFKSILLTSVFLSNHVFAAPTESARCAETNDSLSIEQAAARTAWAFKCYPGLRGTMKGKQVLLRDTQTGETFPGYPTFAHIDDEGNILSYWAGPVDSNATCDGSDQYSFIGFCRAGCYTPDQVVLFSEGFIPIKEASSSLKEELVVVAKDSTMDRIELVTALLDSYTVDPISKAQKILKIKTQDGGEIKVTLNHPLLDSKGYMRSANTLRVGESLVKMDGVSDVITSIEEYTYTGKVYNVKPTSNNPSENIVVAQGFLNGSVYFQNEGIKEMNRLALRAGNIIPDSLVQ